MLNTFYDTSMKKKHQAKSLTIDFMICKKERTIPIGQHLRKNYPDWLAYLLCLIKGLNISDE